MNSTANYGGKGNKREGGQKKLNDGAQKRLHKRMDAGKLKECKKRSLHGVHQ